MAICDQCGNEYEPALQVTQGEKNYIFDSFQCAVEKMAPRCPNCETRVIGHGTTAAGQVFCCTPCAEAYTAKPTA